MKFNQSIIATALSLSLAFGVVAAEKKHQTITIKANDNNPIELTVTNDGNAQVYMLSADALNNKDILVSELNGVSSETIEHISQALKGLHSVEGHDIDIDVKQFDDETSNKKIHKIVEIIRDENDDEAKGSEKEVTKFAFVSSDSDNLVVDVDHLNSQGGVPFNIIKRLVNKSKLTKDQLNELQQLIDSKR